MDPLKVCTDYILSSVSICYVLPATACLCGTGIHLLAVLCLGRTVLCTVLAFITSRPSCRPGIHLQQQTLPDVGSLTGYPFVIGLL